MTCHAAQLIEVSLFHRCVKLTTVCKAFNNILSQDGTSKVNLRLTTVSQARKCHMLHLPGIGTVLLFSILYCNMSSLRSSHFSIRVRHFTQSSIGQLATSRSRRHNQAPGLKGAVVRTNHIRTANTWRGDQIGYMLATAEASQYCMFTPRLTY